MSARFKNSPESIFGRLLRFTFICTVFLFIVGLILLLIPEVANKVVAKIVGVGLIISGANAIYNYMKREGAKIYSLNLVFGVVYIFFGIMLVLFPISSLKFIAFCLGIYLFISGLKTMNYARWLKIGNEDCWKVTLVSGIMFVIFAIMLFADPFANWLTLTKIAGVFVMVTAVIDFTNTLMFKNRAEQIMSIFW